MEPVEIALPLYQFIVEYKQSHDGAAPTYQEIADGIGVGSKSTIHIYIHKMIDIGVLKVVDGKICVVGGHWTYQGGYIDG